MPEQLEPHQKARLTALETTVRDGLRDFRRTGQALSEIRDNEFFRAGYDSFEAYLQDRWGFTPPQAGRLMEAADVAKVLDPLGIQPRNEAQARTFKAAAKIVTELEPEQQRVVAQLVEGVMPQPTEGDDTPPWELPAAEVRIMASVVKKLDADATVYHPENGREVPMGTLSAPERYEVIRTHVDQKTQAYREKQEAKANAPKPENVNWGDWVLNYAAQNLGPGQRLELVVEPDGSGASRAVARVVDGNTGEILASGGGAVTLKKAALNLAAEVRG
ncbi:hypothetical protein ACFP9V_03675 [Deinococcus radiopugnans]|uniref:Uncharacterized protein n=1 Tax=Deinococcus radiopugnans ATCC 19172 TaxID=585398 RepID=A0A5C4Y7L3_9DEIO|nr:hypothetical protein [Deinococcus radiopugnans]MBB6016970.1 hypothetical protein [Deinococcus radiopugnans ATCC 19172]QLG11458.1 hypothetical protein HLB42_12210 [Deinococcus sp. D7000]TNM71516.1 hypothetical protein FHR04_08205 [Deinococcus radiopugnans ATCC 19172]